MKSLDQFLAEKREVTIHTIASYIRQYIRAQLPSMLEANQEKLSSVFNKAGEYAYGVYGRTLMEPLQEQLSHAGFVAEPEFPGHFIGSSIEYWGPPEERERCLWCVLRTSQGKPLGTIVTRIFHDHTGFRIPHAPGIIALEETETSAILEQLSHASVRYSGAPQEDTIVQEMTAHTERPGWEYSVEVGLADCIDPKLIEASESMLDGSLALWGRYGWELVTAIPYQGRLIAFFKRPVSHDA